MPPRPLARPARQFRAALAFLLIFVGLSIESAIAEGKEAGKEDPEREKRRGRS